MTARLLGAVLAGGRATRFGSDKALALLDGLALIDRVLAALAPQVAGVVVCGRTHPPWESIGDRPAPGLGPLGGLCAALLHAADHGFDAVMSAPCDLPGLPDDLAAALGDGPSFVADGPVVGCWPTSLGPALRDRLHSGGDRSMRGWAAAAGARAVTLAVPLSNINHPRDLERLRVR